MGPRHTKIVCTLGPATYTEERLEALLRAGMNVARLNFSHGTHDEHAATIARVRRVAQRLGFPVAILQDLQGPKIRTGSLVNGGSVALPDGGTVTITTQQVAGTAARISTTYAALPQDVRPGDTVLLSDGAIELRVRDVQSDEVRCAIVHGGTLAEHQGINLPGVAVSAPSLTEKDREDLAFGIRLGVDYVALSFVRRPEDIEAARAFIAAHMGEYGAAAPPEGRMDAQATSPAHDAGIPVIAKLEKPEAIARLDDILRVSDGVMVARGDLGVEMPLERVPVVQKHIIARANAYGLPVITATQMLESMVHNPRPTRAEASDVANAILDGTDAVMLSAETSIGTYPVEAVEVMARIAVETEAQWTTMTPEPSRRTLAHAVSAAAHTLAEHVRAPLIAVFTRSGLSAQLISKERPHACIVAYTPDPVVYRRLALWRGVQPRLSTLAGTTEELIAWVDGQLQAEGLAHRGDDIVIMGGMPLAGQARTNFVKLHRVGET
jgi:pyruvate kinase